MFQAALSEHRYLALMRDKQRGGWLLFSRPAFTFEVHEYCDVLPTLQEIEALVAERELFAVGALSYEAAGAFDAALETHETTDFPLLWFGLYHAPKRLAQLPARLPEELDTLGAISSDAPVPHELVWTPSVSRRRYFQAFSKIKAHIQRGDTYQVNYTLRLDADFSGQPWSLFLQSIKAQPTAYAAYLDLGRFVLCSASPELFFRLDGTELLALPMKGTASRGQTQEEDRRLANWLFHSEKNRAENVMIVDMLRNDLTRIAVPTSVKAPRLFQLEAYPAVWQMVSEVRAQTFAKVSEILAALFPCASITGAPKVRTMQLIKQLESTPRAIYTGAIGWIFPRRHAQFQVAIRTALVDRFQQRSQLGVGGGIVWESKSEDEYQECLLKAQFLTGKIAHFH